VETTEALLESLGLTIHRQKSIILPSQKITSLGFDIDTVNI